MHEFVPFTPLGDLHYFSEKIYEQQIDEHDGLQFLN